MIRKAKPVDADTLAEIYIGSRNKHVELAPLAYTEDEIRSWIRDILIPGGTAELLEQDRSVVAMMATSEDNSGSWIDHLYVRADLTRNGCESILLAHAMRTLKRPTVLFFKRLDLLL